jgi:hypothetical protein
LPVREISDSRVTTPAMIHCWSVASSRQLFCSPFSRRSSHCRSIAVGASSGPSRATSSNIESGRPGRVEVTGGLGAGGLGAGGLGIGALIIGGLAIGTLGIGALIIGGPAIGTPGIGALAPVSGDLALIGRGRAPLTSGAIGAPTLVGVRRRILNMWPQLVHFTVTPPGFRRASSSSYSV